MKASTVVIAVPLGTLMCVGASALFGAICGFLLGGIFAIIAWGIGNDAGSAFVRVGSWSAGIIGILSMIVSVVRYYLGLYEKWHQDRYQEALKKEKEEG